MDITLVISVTVTIISLIFAIMSQLALQTQKAKESGALLADVRVCIAEIKTLKEEFKELKASFHQNDKSNGELQAKVLAVEKLYKAEHDRLDNLEKKVGEMEKWKSSTS